MQSKVTKISHSYQVHLCILLNKTEFLLTEPLIPQSLKNQFHHIGVTMQSERRLSVITNMKPQGMLF